MKVKHFKVNKDSRLICLNYKFALIQIFLSFYNEMIELFNIHVKYFIFLMSYVVTFCGDRKFINELCPYKTIQ